MRQVISAPPALDASRLAARLAEGRAIVTDPAPALCLRYGYQTLYEIPAGLQKKLRRELIRGHAELLRENPECVCDHSVFLYLADWMRWTWSATSTEEWEAVLVEAWPAVERSDRIHHVVSGPRALYDGYRWLDSGNAKQVDRLMRNLYRDFECEGRVIETDVGA